MLHAAWMVPQAALVAVVTVAQPALNEACTPPHQLDSVAWALATPVAIVVATVAQAIAVATWMTVHAVEIAAAICIQACCAQATPAATAA